MERLLREDGIYAGRIIDYAVSRNANTGNPQLIGVVDVCGRFAAALDPDDCYQKFPSFVRRVFWPITPDREEDGEFVPGTVSRVLADLRHLGFPGASLRDLDGKFEFDRLKVHKWECRTEEYEGMLTNRWSLFRPVDRDTPRAQEAFADLARMFGGERAPARRRRGRREEDGADAVTNGEVA